MRRPVLRIDFTRFHSQSIELFGLPPQLPCRDGTGQVLLHLIEFMTNFRLLGLQGFVLEAADRTHCSQLRHPLASKEGIAEFVMPLEMHLNRHL